MCSFHRIIGNCSLLLCFMKEFIDQLLSRVLLFATAWTTACQASLSFTVSLSLLRLISLESTMPSKLCHSLLMPSIFFSIRVFSSESTVCIRWPKHWSFSFIISPSNEYSGFISFRIGWFDFLAIQGLSRVFSSTTILVIRSLITSTLLDCEFFKSEDYVSFLLITPVVGTVPGKIMSL